MCTPTHINVCGIGRGKDVSLTTVNPQKLRPPRNLGHSIFQSNHWEKWTTLDLLLVAISQSMDNFYSSLDTSFGKSKCVFISEYECTHNLQWQSL